MNFQEDLDIFTKGEFGVAALINGREIWGLFDESYEPVFDDLKGESKKITLMIKSEEAGGMRHGFPVELITNSRVFEIVGIQPFDDGKLTNLVLKEL